MDLLMKMSKNKRRRQQQGGKPVLVTSYVVQPKDRGGSTSTASSSYHHRHKQQHQDHHHSHGGGLPDMQRRRRRNDGRKSQSNNRRADLLEYSRQLRASARQTAATTATVSSTPPPPPPHRRPPPRRDRDTSKAVGVHRDEGRQAAVNRLERAMSQQQIRQRCFGGDDWSWKRVLLLLFPFHGNKGRRPRNRSNHRDDSEKNVKINQTGRPAALLFGKLAVSKDRRDRSGFLKTLTSFFQKRSR